MSRHARKLLWPVIGATATVTALVLQCGSAVAATPAFTVTDSVTAGFNTHAVVFDAGTHEAYVAGAGRQPGRDAVTAVDTVTKTVVATVETPTPPIQLAYDSAKHAVYTSLRRKSPRGVELTGLVDVIDDQTHAITASITVGRRPDGLAVDPALGRLYVVNDVDSTVSVVDTTTRAVIATVSLTGAPQGITADSVTHRVYVAETSNRLEVIDGTDNTVTAQVALSGRPSALDVDMSTGIVYVGITGAFGAKVSAVDEATGAETGTTASFGAARYVAALTVNPVNHKIYTVAGFWARFIDGPTLSYNAKVDVHRSYGIDVDTATDTIYAAHLGQGNPAGGSLYILHRSPH